MKVLVVHPGASWSTADVEAGLTFGLQKHGVTVVKYRLDSRIERAGKWLNSAWRVARKKNKSIPKPTSVDIFYQAGIGVLERALRHQVHAVIVVSAMYLHPDIIVLLRRAGVFVTVLFTESPYDIEKECEVAKLANGCWTMERSSIPQFCEVNPCSGYVPHGWHPERHRPVQTPLDESVPAHDVVFVGTAFRERIELLEAIDWSGIDLGIYGEWEALSEWERMQKRPSPLRPFVRQELPIDNVKAAALYRRAKIGLNLYRKSIGFGLRAPYIQHAESINPRGYELAACGTFHLSEFRSEVPEVFGQCVPTFSTPEQAEQLIRKWLRDPDGRAQLADQLPALVAESSWVERSTRVIGDLQSLLGRNT